jgi:hypothetical protein
MNITEILVILVAHWIADFVFQTDKMAKGKSSSNYMLSLHIASYTTLIAFFMLSLLSLKMAIAFALLNGVLHFITDYFSSRASSKLWAKGDVHNFFVVIGLDQTIHYATLFATYYYLF